MAYAVSDIDALLRINGDYAQLYTRMVTMRAPFGNIISVGFPESYILEWLGNYKHKVRRCSGEAGLLMKMYPTINIIIAMIRAKMMFGMYFPVKIVAENVDTILERARESPKLAAAMLTQSELLGALPLSACYKLCYMAMTNPVAGHQECIKYLTPEYLEVAEHKRKNVSVGEVMMKRNYRMVEHLSGSAPTPIRIIKSVPAHGSLAVMRRQLRMFPTAAAEIITVNILHFEDEHFEAFPIDAPLAKRLLRASSLYGRPTVVRRLHAIMREAR